MRFNQISLPYPLPAAIHTQYARLTLLVLVLIGVALLRDQLPWLTEVPAVLILPITDWVRSALDWLITSLDFGPFTFKDVTRALAWLLYQPIDFAEVVLVAGRQNFAIGAVPWVAVVGGVAILGHYLGGRRLALIAGGCFLYLALFGQWQSAMQTFTILIVAVPIAVLLGLGLGVLAARVRRVEMALLPILDVMQSLPHYAYLVPIVFLFGFGAVPATIATIIFATPPMVRCTILGIKSVPKDVIDAGWMSGCSPRQLLWKVQIPAARPTLMLGVNQVILQTLGMVVIASLIGASGLGHDLLVSLQSLKIGRSIEQGLAIVLIAIALDRLSQAATARRHAAPRPRGAALYRFRHATLAVALLIVSFVLARYVPAIEAFPKGLAVTTAPFWDTIVDWITLNLYDVLEAFRVFLLVEILIPFRNFLVGLPWVVPLLLVMWLGFELKGLRLAVPVGLLVMFIAISGFWPQAMVTVYMTLTAVIIATAIGIPTGIWASRNSRVAAFVLGICDLLQTFPSFVYLIPVIMLFKIGDVAAIFAVIVYAWVPAARYTIFGIRKVPPEIIEAAIISGCTRRQMLRKVQLPVALPEIMLGVNQTIMFSLVMVAIAAFIGTRDLGNEVLKSVGWAEPGRGLVAGFCIASLGILANLLIGAWSARRKERLGLT